MMLWIIINNIIAMLHNWREAFMIDCQDHLIEGESNQRWNIFNQCWRNDSKRYSYYYWIKTTNRKANLMSVDTHNFSICIHDLSWFTNTNYVCRLPSLNVSLNLAQSKQQNTCTCFVSIDDRLYEAAIY